MSYISIFQKVGFRLLYSTRKNFFSFISNTLYKVLGAKIGKKTKLYRVYITWPHQLKIGDNGVIEHNVYFKYDGAWQPGPSIIIGNKIFIGSGVEFNIKLKIEIGDNVLIASGSRFIDHDHGFYDLSVPMNKQLGPEKEIIIGEDVWIGCNVVILKGVSIGKGAIIAAGAVVSKSVLPYEIWAGVPAKKIGERGVRKTMHV